MPAGLELVRYWPEWQLISVSVRSAQVPISQASPEKTVVMVSSLLDACPPLLHEPSGRPNALDKQSPVHHIPLLDLVR